MPPVAPGCQEMLSISIGLKIIKSPIKSDDFGHPRILLDSNLVEAGGIEPPSESLQRKASTCLVRALNLAAVSPANRIPPRPVSKSLTPHSRDEKCDASP